MPPTAGLSAIALQLFVMDDDGSNVEKIGHLNLGSALHPVILKDGRIMFSSLEAQGLRDDHRLGHLEHPSRRHQLGPARQRLRSGGADASTSRRSSPTAASSSRSTTTRTTTASAPTCKLPPQPPHGHAAVRARLHATIRATAAAHRPHDTARHASLPFSPYGMEALTPFAHGGDCAGRSSDPEGPEVAARRQVHASRPARRTTTC